MKKSRFTESQIMSILKEAESGVSASDLCRKHGMSDATFVSLQPKTGFTLKEKLGKMMSLTKGVISNVEQVTTRKEPFQSVLAWPHPAVERQRFE